MKVEEILNVTKGKLIIGNLESEVENFSKDTRTIQNGDIYIGIKGDKFDGSDFWKQALDSGAKAVIISKKNITENEKKEYKDKIIIEVEDTLNALYELAKYKRKQYNIPVVAITGSVGKTSTKDIVANVLSQKFKTLKTEGNFNNNIGLPMTILRLKNHEALVVEMGMNHFGEIRKLANIAKPTVAVITNIGTAHIGNLGSRENILKAKMEILEGLQTKTVIINNDNDLLHKWAFENNDKYQIITYGIKKDSKYMAKNIELYEDKSEFEFEGETVTVPVGGEHFILNSLCGIAIGKLFNISIKDIIVGIKNLDLSKKRMEIEKSKIGAILINDTYNANYDSMKAAINYLKNIQNKRKIAVLGDMLELGDFSKELHEKVGKEVDSSIDILIVVGKEAKYIAKESNAKEKYIFDKNTEAINKIKEIITKDDAILFKASNGMHFNEIVNKLNS